MVPVSFNYVVEREQPNRVFFGSSKHRSTSPIGPRLSAFQRKKASENFPNVGPGFYNITLPSKKVYSRKGYGGLAKNSPRFNKTSAQVKIPDPGKYGFQPHWRGKTSVAPFGSTIPRLSVKPNNIPGPGTYKLTEKCRHTKFLFNYGKPTMVSAIETICVYKFTHNCLKCGKLIVEGNYWHRNHDSFLCHLCWDEEKRTREIFKENELKLFNKIRNCTFCHSHEGTTAAVRLMPKRRVVKKIRLENYLELFLKC